MLQERRKGDRQESARLSGQGPGDWPPSQNIAVTVEMLAAATTPTEEKIAEKRGVMSWTLDLAPDDAGIVRLVYRRKWPLDRDGRSKAMDDGTRAMAFQPDF